MTARYVATGCTITNDLGLENWSSPAAVNIRSTAGSCASASNPRQPWLGGVVGKHLNVTVTPQSDYDFANGEMFVRFDQSASTARWIISSRSHCYQTRRAQVQR